MSWEKNSLPLSIIASTLILSVALLVVSGNIATKLDALSASVQGLGGGTGTPSLAPGPSPPSAAPSPAQPLPAPNPSLDMVELAKNASATKGSDNAPVTLIEFSDFQCPFCGRFYSQTLDAVTQNYIGSGKVRFVYKDFPLDSIHPEARPAAEAARCAAEQGKFWQFHDKIFENQPSMSAANYKAWAKELGLDTAKFNSCVDSRKFEDAVQANFNEGNGIGVSGTPTFVIGKSGGKGSILVGAQPYASFQQALDAALAG